MEQDTKIKILVVEDDISLRIVWYGCYRTGIFWYRQLKINIRRWSR